MEPRPAGTSAIPLVAAAMDVGPATSAIDGGNRPTRIRYQVMAAACALAVLTYVLRVGFAVASPQIKNELQLSSTQLAYLMAAFLLAYGMFEAPGGWLADRIGVRHFLTLLVLGASTATGLLSAVGLLPANLTLQFGFLFLLRFCFGMLQAGVFPSCSRMLTDWMPVGRRASAQGFIWMSARLGGAIAPLLLAGLGAWFSWQTSLWLIAGLGALWCASFWPWFRNRPQTAAGVNAAELELISANKPVRNLQQPHLSWSRLLGSANVWGLCLMYGFGGVGASFFITILPDYLKYHRGLDVADTKWLTSLPLACGVVACVAGGFLSDALIQITGSRKWGRRLNGMIGLSCAGLAMLATLWVEDVRLLAVLLSLAFACNDLNMAPAWASCADIGERYAGTIGGTMNMVGNLFPAATTILIGHLLATDTAWNIAGTRILGKELVFIMFAACYLLAASSWLLVDVTKPLLSEGR